MNNTHDVCLHHFSSLSFVSSFALIPYPILTVCPPARLLPEALIARYEALGRQIDGRVATIRVAMSKLDSADVALADAQARDAATQSLEKSSSTVGNVSGVDNEGETLKSPTNEHASASPRSFLASMKERTMASGDFDVLKEVATGGSKSESEGASRSTFAAGNENQEPHETDSNDDAAPSFRLHRESGQTWATEATAKGKTPHATVAPGARGTGKAGKALCSSDQHDVS